MHLLQRFAPGDAIILQGGGCYHSREDLEADAKNWHFGASKAVSFYVGQAIVVFTTKYPWESILALTSNGELLWTWWVNALTPEDLTR